jgi:hypothetical protein
MSAYLELTAELEKNKVKCLMVDCPEEFNKFLGNFSHQQMNFLLNEGILSSATIWEKFIEWSGRKKHNTGHGADFEDGTDAKFSSIHEWQGKIKQKHGIKLRDRLTATIAGVQKNGDLLIAVYNRWNDKIDYFQIPQDVIPNNTINIEYNHQTKECSSKWGKYKVDIKDILLKYEIAK